MSITARTMRDSLPVCRWPRKPALLTHSHRESDVHVAVFQRVKKRRRASL